MNTTDKVVSLGDISIFTDEREMPLREVFQAIEDKLGKKVIEFDWRKASNPELLKFFGEIIPDFDRERVYPSHIKKIAGWYDLLVKYGENDFSEPKAEEEDILGHCIVDAVNLKKDFMGTRGKYASADNTLRVDHGILLTILVSGHTLEILFNLLGRYQ